MKATMTTALATSEEKKWRKQNNEDGIEEMNASIHSTVTGVAICASSCVCLCLFGRERQFYRHIWSGSDAVTVTATSRTDVN